jgi:hypothetical protein
VCLDTGGQEREASVIRLEGPALDARTKITLGGAEVTSAGTWKPSSIEKLPVTRGQIAISLAATTAAMVKVFPSLS